MHSDRRDGGVVCRPVIICGSGPCLSDRLVQLDRLRGIPILAVSTAIRVIEKPDIWVVLDDINHHHGGHQAYESARDKDVKKVVHSTRHYFWDKFPNVEYVHVYRENHKDRHSKKKRRFFDGGDGVLRGFNRSMTFAIQWAFHHYNCAIFCGMDHLTTAEIPYAYDGEMQPKMVENQNNNHRKELHQIKVWSPLALSKGFVWLNWCPAGSPMATACHGEFDGFESVDRVFRAALGDVSDVGANV